MWYANPRDILEMYQVPDKVVVLQRDQLHLGGNPYELYLAARSTESTSISCDCLTGQVVGTEPVGSREPNTKCEKCYGVGLAPGYRKFMHETLFWFSGEYQGFTLSNVTREIDYVSPRLVLADGALSGTIETPDKTYDNSGGDAWETDTQVYVPDNTTGAESGYSVEFSTDSGGTWNDLADINGANQPVGTGTIRLRVMLSRTDVDVRSPMFSILRLRHLRSADVNPVPISKQAGSDRPLLPGQILMIKTWQSQQWAALEDRGVIEEREADRSWTTGLSYWDTSVVENSPGDLIRSGEVGDPAIIVQKYGPFEGQRLSLFAPRYNEQMNRVTRQEFSERRIQLGEILYRVW